MPGNCLRQVKRRTGNANPAVRHMDTARPGIGKQPVFARMERSLPDGTTVLGADDLTGVIAILEGIRAVQDARIPHRDIEISFAAAGRAVLQEEARSSILQPDESEGILRFDVTGPVGTAIPQAPTILSFEAGSQRACSTRRIRAEKGIHAIQTAARVIAALKLGHVDEETTLNVGLISGGSVVNAAPELCTCRGEIRSYSHEKAMETLEDVRRCLKPPSKRRGQSFLTHRLHVKAFHLNRTRRWQFILPRPAAPGIEPKFGSTFGGSDGNTMMQHGIPCAVLSCGMYDVHSVREYAKIGDIVNGARLIAELITQGQEASIE